MLSTIAKCSKRSPIQRRIIEKLLLEEEAKLKKAEEDRKQR
jgi:hypothetical protein